MSNYLPEGWSEKPLEEIATKEKSSIVDGPFGSNLKTSDYVTSGIPVLQGKNITNDKFDWFDIRYITKSKAEELRRSSVTVGDILIVKIGSVGYSAIVENLHGHDYSIIPANLLKISINKKLHSNKYIHYYLTSPEGRQRLIDLASKTAQPALSLSSIKKFTIPVPKLSEQQKIATILSSVDDVIEKTRAQIDKLKDLKTGMMQELLTKGIGHTEFKDSPVGRIPTSWAVTDLRSVVIKDGLQTGPFGSQLHAHEYVEWGIPVVMPKDMINNRVDTSSIARISPQKADELKKHSVRSGDILFSRRGDIGRFVLIDEEDEGAICGTGCLRVRTSEVVNPFYLACYLTTSNIVEWLNANAVGQTMLNLNTSILANLPVVLPSKAEQKSIGQTIFTLEENIRLKSEKFLALEKLKKALMQDLLTGKVRVKLDSTEVAAA